MKRIFTLLIFIIGLSSNSWALDISLPSGFLNVYSSIKLNGTYQMYSEGLPPLDLTVDIKQEIEEGSRFLFGLQSNSWIGFDFNFSNLFGKAEISILPDDEYNEIFLRQFYAGISYENFSILVGRTVTDSQTALYFNDIFFNYGGLAGMGTIESTIRNAIKFSFFGATISVIDVSPDIHAMLTGNKLLLTNVADPITGAGSVGIINSNNVLVKSTGILIPRIDFSYKITVNEAFIKLLGSFGMFDFYDIAAPDTTVSAIAATGAAVISGSINPGFGLGYLTATAFYSMNGGLLGQVSTPNISDGVFSIDRALPIPSVINGKLELDPVLSFGVAVSLQYYLSSYLFIEGGVGYQTSSSSSFIDYRILPVDRNPEKLREASTSAIGAYLQVSWEIFNGLYIVPQISYYTRFSNVELIYNASAFLGGLQLKYQL